MFEIKELFYNFPNLIFLNKTKRKIKMKIILFLLYFIINLLIMKI